MNYKKYFNDNSIVLDLIPCVDLKNLHIVSNDDLKTMYHRIYRLMRYCPQIIHELQLRVSGLGFGTTGLLYEENNDYIACSLLNYNTLYKNIEFATPEFQCLIHIGNGDRYAFDLMESILFKSKHSLMSNVDVKGEFMDFLMDYTNISDYLD